jgi:outer membrane protein OmpA-like peptidoglycan-associated protein
MRLNKTITGKVLDAESKRPVIAELSIGVKGKSSFESHTNNMGQFTVTISDAAECTVSVHAMGFEILEDTIEVSASSPNYVEILLTPAIKMTMDGKVLGGPPDHEVPLTATLTVYVNSDFIKADSALAFNGTYKESFTNFGWYIIDFSAPGFLDARDTVWVMNSSRKVFHKDFHLTPLDSKLTTALNNIEFDFGKSSLRPESYTELDYVSQFLKRNPDKLIQITGHTDNSGQASYNLMLSRARAQAVADYLRAKGVSVDQVSIEAYGAQKLIDSTTSAAARAKNRRAELVLVNK